MKSGDCLSCGELSNCGDTSIEKVQQSYTCGKFSGVEEPVYLARLEAIRRFGDRSAIMAMLNKVKVTEEPEPKEEGDNDE